MKITSIYRTNNEKYSILTIPEKTGLSENLGEQVFLSVHFCLVS